MRKNLETRQLNWQTQPPPEPFSADTKNATLAVDDDDDSSDESGVDEIIVSIDSPSRLSFREAL